MLIFENGGYRRCYDERDTNYSPKSIAYLNAWSYHQRELYGETAGFYKARYPYHKEQFIADDKFNQFLTDGFTPDEYLMMVVSSVLKQSHLAQIWAAERIGGRELLELIRFATKNCSEPVEYPMHDFLKALAKNPNLVQSSHPELWADTTTLEIVVMNSYVSDLFTPILFRYFIDAGNMTEQLAIKLVSITYNQYNHGGDRSALLLNWLKEQNNYGSDFPDEWMLQVLGLVEESTMVD